MEHINLFSRHRGPVTCAVQIPGSNKIITSGYDCAVAVFDRDSHEVTLLGYHQHLVNRVSVNSTGTLAVTSSSDYALYLWDLKQMKLLKVLQGHDDDVEDFVFISDQLGASVSRDWRVMLWNLDSGAIQRVLLGHEKDVLSVGYLNGKLYTSGDDMTLRSWDIETGKQLNMIGPFDTETDTCAIDPLNKRIVLGCDDGIVRVFDIDSGALIEQMSGHASAIKKVAVSPINGDILSAAYDQRILIWDSQSFQRKQQLEHRFGLWERSFNWAPESMEVVAGTFDGTVLVWNAETGECLQELGAELTPLGNACFNDITFMAADKVATVSDDGIVRIAQMQAGEGQWLEKWAPASGRVLMNAVTYCPVLQRVITGAHNQQIFIFEPDAPTTEGLGIMLYQGPINCIRTSEVEGYEGHIFVACYSGTIMHLGVDGQELQQISVHSNAVKALCLLPDKAIGVSCCAEGELVSWNFDGTPIHHYAGHTAIIDDVDVDPSGQYIASAGRDFILKIHHLHTSVLLHSIHLGRRSPKSLCFYDSDTVIVSNYWGELLRVDLRDGSILRRTIAANGISAVACHGGLLAVSSYDGSIYLVTPDELEVVSTLRAMVQRVEEPAYV